MAVSIVDCIRKMRAEGLADAHAQTVLVENVRTLEDLVREMLQPMLRLWLDDNLPTLVERLVLVEIERIACTKSPEHKRRGSDIIFG